MKKNKRQNTNSLPKNSSKISHEGEQKAIQSVKAARKAVLNTRRDTTLLHDVSVGIVKGITLPKESEPFRIGSAYGGDPTAAARIFSRLNVIGAPAGSALPQVVPERDTIGFAFRDALRSSVYSFGLQAGQSCQYNASFQAELPVSPTTVYPAYDDPFTLDEASSNVSPHGKVLYTGRLDTSDQHRGFLCSAGSTIQIVIAPFVGLPAATRVFINLEVLEGLIWRNVQSNSFDPLVGDNTLFPVLETGYYSFTFNTAVTGPTSAPAARMTGIVNLRADSGNLASMFAQQALSGIEDVINSVQAIRLAAVSCMYTNTASPLNRQGQIVGIQLPKCTNFLNYLDFDRVSKLNKSCTLNIVNGMYGFLKPTETEDFDMSVFQYEPAGDIDEDVDYVFDIYPKSDYLLIHAQVVPPDGRQGYWTFSHQVEYTTTSMWADLRTGFLPTETLEVAMRYLSQVPQWHENDFHISDIWDGIKSIAKDIWGGVKEIAGVAAPLIPVAAALL